MIVLDTHIWIWWVHGAAELLDDYRRIIEQHEVTSLGISAISCWEVAKLVEKGRLTLPCPVDEWLDQALAYPGVQLLPLTPSHQRSYRNRFIVILPTKSLLRQHVCIIVHL